MKEPIKINIDYNLNRIYPNEVNFKIKLTSFLHEINFTIIVEILVITMIK